MPNGGGEGTFRAYFQPPTDTHTLLSAPSGEAGTGNSMCYQADWHQSQVSLPTWVLPQEPPRKGMHKRCSRQHPESRHAGFGAVKWPMRLGSAACGVCVRGQEHY